MSDTLSFDRSAAAETGIPIEVAPDVKRIVAGNAGPFTFTGTATYVIGRENLMVIDPGPDLDAHLQALVDVIGARPVSHVVITHTHRDHVEIAERLARTVDAPIAGRAFVAKPDADGKQGLDAAHLQDFAPDIVIEDGAEISNPETRLTTIATPGHADNHFAFADPERRVLYSGDHVMAWSTSVVAPPDGDMTDYLASLEKLLDRPEDQFLPGHGGPVRQPKRFVRGLLTHRRQRETQILTRLNAGACTLDALVTAVYPELDPKLRGAAGLSSRAHLERLVGLGKVVSDTGDKGETVWRVV